MKRILQIKKNILFFCFLVSFSVLIPKTVAATVGCTILASNLSLGDTNSGTGNQVYLLQNFLYGEGYLTSVPTGHFGSLTETAVKAFQTAQNISAVGTVGPITRSAIQRISCSSSLINNPPATTTSTAQNYLVTSPSAGANLVVGQNLMIEWSGISNQTMVNVVLENANGGGAGYIASNLLGQNYYQWTVGNVSIEGNPSSTIPPGYYRIRVTSSLSSGLNVDVASGLFYINESQLSISNILPSSGAPNDGKTAIILYGRGYTSLSQVEILGQYNTSIIPQYFSPDGNFIWFYVPKYVIPGQYQIYAFNNYSNGDYSSNATGTPSNYETLQVIQGSQ